MTIITIAAAGIATVLLAVQLKGIKGEYAAYMVMAAGFFIFFYGTGKLRAILDALEQIQFLFHTPVPLRTFPARFRQRASIFTDLLRGQVTDKCLALADQL